MARSVKHWKRQDVAGCETCRLSRTDQGWRLDGVTIDEDGGAPRGFRYIVCLDAAWRPKSARVTGWSDENDFDLTLDRHPTGWAVNGTVDPALQDATDIDLGFTPATNLCAIRRLDLAIGDSGESQAVWLNDNTWQVAPLRQSYRRRSATRYDYRSQTGYETTLTADENGWIVTYPGLWQAHGGHAP
ncbi:putative glycolipid-binding domain-containing protein [Gymnodinialimonas sp. 2305UL16-5]|uniref:putative glycolipid-binding domain-containing protein n=1 Tax=Gymnodinialimonas mytili TaxID=3126503 RepID=UPI0030AFDD43